MTTAMKFENRAPAETYWTTVGPMRLALVPNDISREEFSRIFVVGRYWLDKREWGLARLLVQGKTRKEIGHILAMSDDGTGECIKALYGKLGATNEKDACYQLGRNGLLVPAGSL